MVRLLSFGVVFAGLSVSVTAVAQEWPTRLETKDDCKRVAEIVVSATTDETFEGILKTAIERYWNPKKRREDATYLPGVLGKTSAAYAEDLGSLLESPIEYLGRIDFGSRQCFFGYLVQRERGGIPWFLVFHQLGSEWEFAGLSLGQSAASGISLFHRHFSALDTDTAQPLKTKPLETSDEWPHNISDEISCRQVADRLISGISAGRGEETVLSMLKFYRHDNAPQSLQEDMNSLRIQATQRFVSEKTEESEYGPIVPHVYEYIGCDMIGENLLSFAFYVERQRISRPWVVNFYRGRDGWLVSGLFSGKAAEGPLNMACRVERAGRTADARSDRSSPERANPKRPTPITPKPSE